MENTHVDFVIGNCIESKTENTENIVEVTEPITCTNIDDTVEISLRGDIVQVSKSVLLLSSSPLLRNIAGANDGFKQDTPKTVYLSCNKDVFLHILGYIETGEWPCTNRFRKEYVEKICAQLGVDFVPPVTSSEIRKKKRKEKAMKVFELFASDVKRYLKILMKDITLTIMSTASKTYTIGESKKDASDFKVLVSYETFKLFEGFDDIHGLVKKNQKTYFLSLLKTEFPNVTVKVICRDSSQRLALAVCVSRGPPTFDTTAIF